ncbi:MAG: hypothetical protein M3680_02860 [Myxococcota bacterium]|nr:hypothetical protein [Myxococcota bacterium]
MSTTPTYVDLDASLRARVDGEAKLRKMTLKQYLTHVLERSLRTDSVERFDSSGGRQDSIDLLKLIHGHVLATGDHVTARSIEQSLATLTGDLRARPESLAWNQPLPSTAAKKGVRR